MCDEYSDEIHEYDPYDAGYAAFLKGEDFCEEQDQSWIRGWEDAEDDATDRKKAEQLRAEK